MGVCASNGMEFEIEHIGHHFDLVIQDGIRGMKVFRPISRPVNEGPLVDGQEGLSDQREASIDDDGHERHEYAFETTICDGHHTLKLVLLFVPMVVEIIVLISLCFNRSKDLLSMLPYLCCLDGICVSSISFWPGLSAGALQSRSEREWMGE